MIYRLDNDQHSTLMYILNHLTVTGPDQGNLLNNAAVILRSLKPEPEIEPDDEDNKEEK